MSKKMQALRRGEVLVMKVVEADGGSYNGFIWPTSVGASVEAPDWNPTASCGNGLHGWLWGLGDLSACSGRDAKTDAVWMALAVTETDVVDLGGKVKFPRCRIVATGDRTAIANFISERRPANTPVPMFGQAAAGSRGQAAAGEAGQAAAGEAGQAAAGYAGQAAAGYAGQAAAGSRGQAAVEADGLATCGVGGLVKGGANAVLVAMFSTGPEHSDFSYSVGQVGRAGIDEGVWYEGSVDGLRRVGDDDARVKAWTAAWKLFDERKAAREALLEKSNEAHRCVLVDKIASSIKPIEPRK